MFSSVPTVPYYLCYYFSFRLQNESYKHLRDSLACAKSFRDIEIASDAIKCSLLVSCIRGHHGILYIYIMHACINVTSNNKFESKYG